MMKKIPLNEKEIMGKKWSELDTLRNISLNPIYL